MLRILTGLLCAAFFAATAHAQSGYQIRPGDTLQIEVLEDPSLNRSALVLPDGSFSFPLIGTVQAGGRSVNDVRSSLTSGLAPNFAAQPNVFVAVAATAERQNTGAILPPDTQEIYVTGEINSPGRIEATPGVTLLQAIAQAGGLTRFAAGKRIQLRRRDQIYYYNYLLKGKPGTVGGQTVLAPGDVIVVPQRRLFE